MKKTTIVAACCIAFIFGWLCCLTGFFYIHLLEHGQEGLRPPDPPPERMVVKTIGDKAFRVKVPEGDSTVTLSILVHVQIRARDELAFNRRYESCKPEIEDRILTILKASTAEERMEATLTAIKEKIKRGINEVLGTPYVQRVLVTEFSLELQ
jgi:flagellar basal body-associated protein FliL